MKNNIIKSIITALLACGLALFIALNFTSCASNENVVLADDSMFFVIEQDFTTSVNKPPSWSIVYDKETKVMYAISNGQDNRGTFTLLVDADGKPKLYEK